MTENHNLTRWRETIVSKLRDRYGLSVEDARTKTDAWMKFIDESPHPQDYPEITAKRCVKPNLSKILLSALSTVQYANRRRRLAS